MHVTTIASQDSDDGAHITSAPDEPSSIGQSQQLSIANNQNGQQQQQTISGHHDEKQRRFYLILLAFSILNALLGLILLFVWMMKYSPMPGIGFTDSAELSNLHPILMYIFMVSLNMYSILVYRTHFNEPKNRLKWTHAILSGINLLMSILGVAAMYKAHLIKGRANFYSLHSWIGTLTNAFYLTQFVFGFVAFLKPGMTQQKRAQLMPWHRLAGAIILVLASTAAITGITELVIFQDTDQAYSKFTAITFIANITGISIILMTATSIYLVTAPQYLRPALPEEAPLKR